MTQALRVIYSIRIHTSFPFSMGRRCRVLHRLSSLCSALKHTLTTCQTVTRQVLGEPCNQPQQTLSVSTIAQATLGICLPFFAIPQSSHSTFSCHALVVLGVLWCLWHRRPLGRASALRLRLLLRHSHQLFLYNQHLLCHRRHIYSSYAPSLSATPMSKNYTYSIPYRFSNFYHTLNNPRRRCYV